MTVNELIKHLDENIVAEGYGDTVIGYYDEWGFQEISGTNTYDAKPANDRGFPAEPSRVVLSIVDLMVKG